MSYSRIHDGREDRVVTGGIASGVLTYAKE